MPPAGYLYTYKGRYLSRAEKQEIAAFAQTVSGVSHHILVISVTSPTEVEVESGGNRSPKNIEWHDIIRLKKSQGHWRVVGKERLKVIPPTGS